MRKIIVRLRSLIGIMSTAQRLKLRLKRRQKKPKLSLSEQKRESSLMLFAMAKEQIIGQGFCLKKSRKNMSGMCHLVLSCPKVRPQNCLNRRSMKMLLQNFCRSSMPTVGRWWCLMARRLGRFIFLKKNSQRQKAASNETAFALI